MKRFFLLSYALVFTVTVLAQRYEYVYRNSDDSTVNCYLKVIPEKTTIKGLIIRDYSSLPDTSAKPFYHFTELAAEQGLMTVYTVTSTYIPELFYTDSCIYILDEIVAEVIKEHNISEKNIFAGGISASGTRALRYAQFCAAGKSNYNHLLNGVFAVDSPLDLARFYYSAINHADNFKSGMLSEAQMMAGVFQEKFGGSPDDFPEKYKAASVFSHQDSSGGNTPLLKNTGVILFHEPDITWWLEERGSSYYDINSFDIAAFYLALLKSGNMNAELVTTTGKGYDRHGNRNCHSWSIVDEPYLVDWILNRLE